MAGFLVLNGARVCAWCSRFPFGSVFSWALDLVSVIILMDEVAVVPIWAGGLFIVLLGGVVLYPGGFKGGLIHPVSVWVGGWWGSFGSLVGGSWFSPE